MKTPQRRQSIEDLQEEVDSFSLSAHELASVLTTVKWSLQTLRDEEVGKINEKQKEILDVLAKETERSITLLHQTLTSLREGSLSHASTEYLFDLTPLLKETIAFFTHEAGHKGMHFIFHEPPFPCSIKGDRSKITIVLHNIVTNAIKYGFPETDIVVILSCDDSAVVVSITNKGAPIPPAELPRLFDKFFRAHNTAQATDGFGLGLYASKQIVEKHGGTLTCTSTDAGTTFSIRLPLPL